ncbi:hypothetical protein ZIOFF_014835 [Zingiber officinale]|uniref:Uncharacterized protein n=1 Tax=Zingiber officinale TaxID=94328 RepID=A0A8J5HBF5_ZINOF|nr:hypothetical protein ZIOFF_014835 [Zingiber officinale]
MASRFSDGCSKRSSIGRKISALEPSSLQLAIYPLLAPYTLVPGSLFGLVTFSHKIGLYDIQGPIAVVKNIFILPDLEDRLPVDLDDVMPLHSFLAPVETCKDRIAALETLKPTTSWERTTAAGQGHDDGVLLGGRGFGVAMTALIDYLSSEYGSTFAQATVAVRAGVWVDIFAITDEYTDLASLKYLSIESGGSLFLYANMDDYTLPQDMQV